MSLARFRSTLLLLLAIPLFAGAQTSATNAAVVRRLFDEVASRGQMALIDQIVAPDFVTHGNPGEPDDPLRGPAAMRAHIQVLRTAFPDLKFTVDQVVAQGDQVAVRWTMAGTHRGTILGIVPSGRHFRVAGMHIFRLVNGKIHDSWSVLDLLSLVQQISPET